MTDTNPNLARQVDPPLSEVDQAARLLEVEMQNKRAEWKKKCARNRSIRAQSFIALFFLIIGCVVIYFVMSSQLNDARATRQPAPSTQK